MRVLSLTILMVLGFAAPASAVQLVNPDGTVAQPYQGWVEGFNVPAYEITVTVTTDASEYSCLHEQAAYACIDSGMLYVLPMCGLPPSKYRRETCRAIIAHEIGHVYQEVLSEAKRQQFARILNLRGFWNASWDVDGGIEEDWADRFAACAIGRRIIQYRYSNGRRMWGTTRASVTPRQHRQICRLIRQPNA